MKRLLAASASAWLLLAPVGCGGSASSPAGIVSYPCVDPTGSRYDPPGVRWRVDADLEYDRPEGLPLLGDLYRPVGGAPWPAVVHIHGGGWTAGDKGMANAVFWGQHLACRGVAFFDVQYRLAPGIHFPDDVRDTHCAVRWLRAHAGAFGLDPARFAAMGGSAGGHLTAMNTLTAGLPEFERTCRGGGPDGEPEVAAASDEIQAAIPFYGVHDWTTWYDPFGEALDLGVVYLGLPEGTRPDRALLAKVSPVTYAGRGTQPFLIIQGTADIGVPVAQALALDEALKEGNHSSRLIFIDGANHGFDADPTTTYTAQAAEALDAFLREVFPP